MLVNFSVENWMSFRGKAEFSMVATKERQHSDRIAFVKKYRTKILPVSAIYGGNASGKTNLCKALKFVKSFVVNGTSPDASINLQPFILDSSKIDEPINFSFELLIDETVYKFSFAATKEKVLEERLTKVFSTTEKDLYVRKERKVTFPGLSKAKKEEAFFKYASKKDERNNQLFITSSVLQDVEDFRPIYDWFKYSLVMIAPDARFGEFELFLDEKSPLYSKMNEVLSRLDTGIINLKTEERPFPFDEISIPESVKNNLIKDLEKNKTIKIQGVPFAFSLKDGKVVVKGLTSYHKKIDGSKAKFELEQESDGTLRAIDLLPAFIMLSSNDMENKVFVIDEIDRSLHTLLTKNLLEMYLSSCSAETRNQLLFTTHDVLLMDQDLFRRDEMWVTERGSDGTSSLFSFSEYKDVRYDKDIRKSYLQGRLGGIPNILLGGIQKNSCNSAKKR